MSRFPTHINNKSCSSQDVNNISWEVVKNHEHTKESLLKVVSLYIIRIYNQGDSEFSLIDKDSFSTILIKINITREVVFVNKLLVIEIMKGIFPFRFNSKKKNSISRLQDLYKYLCSILNMELPKEIEESFSTEYRKSAQLFKKYN